MAAPVAVLAVKATLATATDKNTRTVILSVVAAVLTPFILIITVLLCALSGTANHNNAAVNLTFRGGYLSSSMPEEYRMYIEKMRESFSNLDDALSKINSMTEGETVDDYRVKAIFYALFFGSDQSHMSSDDYRLFADCFVTYEEQEDEEGNFYTVAIPITDLGTVYANLESKLNLGITLEDKTNAQRIYAQAKYGNAGMGGVVEGGNGLPLGVEMGDGSFKALMAEATKYIGFPYVWGGSSPSTSFDCSGYVCWVYTQSGVYNLSRTTAQGIFNQCSVVSREQAKRGDLIFFTGTYASASPVSHIGIYVGGNKMLHCGNPIGYANIDSSYWTSHFYAMGRLPN